MNKSSAPRRPRKTRRSKQEDVEFSKKEESTRKWLTDSFVLLNELRRKDRTFHGLAKEFRFWKESLLAGYVKSKDIAHPRDRGAVREGILRSFLTNSGFLPKKYGVSKMSTRVASTSGHISNELDLVLYDAEESIILMEQEESFQVLPIESTYGTIQIKSRLNRTVLREAFENIASFKRLKPSHKPTVQFSNSRRPNSLRPFGLIFAYESELSWADLVAELKLLYSETEQHLVPNAIVVLSDGHFMVGDGQRAVLYNPDIAQLSKPVIFGFPDRANDVLHSFYSMLMELLRATTVSEVPFNGYYDVPLVADKYSYEFIFGPFVEVLKCAKHGPFAKKISVQNMEKLIAWCSESTAFNWMQLDAEIFMGSSGEENRRENSHNVFVYNPEARPLSQILANDREMTLPDGEKAVAKVLAYDAVHLLSTGQRILIPQHYMPVILDPCPKCKSWEEFSKNNMPVLEDDSK
ncbi:hypothetical protein J2X56_001108 [Herbaspirillum sp. 1173]|uniref:DUF6602 domain-containing protein n=1 Tax=Herbaspirillum sp. 1173 TaxID=2817734 RepID=UPI00285A5EAF|nr:DUF6602 domain-containing protein [Herbaspirillum sp. 1173]MDR6739122.1 hypothetical protein [Herbaspirillum sp. 1173]